jgi:hypothetical protein
MTRIRGSLLEGKGTYLNISRSFLLRMRNISDKTSRENQNRHFMFNNIFFENRAIYEIKWKNIAQPDRPQIKIWRMRISPWTPKGTNTHSQYLTLIDRLQVNKNVR